MSVLEVAKVAYIVRVTSSCYVEVYESHVLHRITGKFTGKMWCSQERGTGKSCFVRKANKVDVA